MTAVVERSGLSEPGPAATGAAQDPPVAPWALERLKSARVLDTGAALLQKGAARLRLPAVSERGEELLGHPVHPALTDIPIGFWTSSCFLDLFGGRHHSVASRRLVGVGVLSALPTVAFGLGDMAKLEGGPRRVATVHAVANILAIGLYTVSWRRRRHGHLFTGVGLGFAAGAVASIGGYLGGALAFSSDLDIDAVDTA